MRMSFWMGGILGAAAAVYYTKYKGQIMPSKLGEQMKTSLGGLMANSTSSSSATQQSKGYGQLEDYISQEPELKQQVNEMLREN